MQYAASRTRVAIVVAALLAGLGAIRAAAIAGHPTTAAESAAGRPSDAGRLQLAQFGVPPANACCTSYAACPLGQLLPVGAQCACYTAYGPIWGYACRL